MDDQIVYWRTLICRGWQIHIGATARGLCFTGGWNQGFEDLAAWAEKRFTQPVFIRDDKGLAEYAEQLQAYLNGKRTHFSFPVDLAGTPFQLAVWKALSEIPYGSTCSYSDIAEHIEKQAAVRAVGAAIGANPLLMVVPCHRVIGKSGQAHGIPGRIGYEKRTDDDGVRRCNRTIQLKPRSNVERGRFVKSQSYRDQGRHGCFHSARQFASFPRWSVQNQICPRFGQSAPL